MKATVFAALLMVSSLASAKPELTRSPAQDAKATICYDEALKYATDLAGANAQVGTGRLEMMSQIGGVQVEGWVFPSSTKGSIVIVASADGSGSSHCTLNFIDASKQPPAPPIGH